jgi:hypothetical protein
MTGVGKSAWDGSVRLGMIKSDWGGKVSLGKSDWESQRLTGMVKPDWEATTLLPPLILILLPLLSLPLQQILLL